MHQSRRIVTAALSLSIVLPVASCSAGEPSAAPSSFSVEPASGSSSAPASPSSTPVPSREETDRGDLKKAIGEVAAINDETSSDPAHWVQFKVTDIKAAECTSGYSEAPTEGNRLLQLDLEIETMPEMRQVFEDMGASPVSLMFNTDWYAYASNGTTMNSIDSSAAASCLSESDQVPFEIGPAEKVAGSVVFEVSDATGEIVHRPWILDGGWSWDYDLTESE